MKSLSTAALVFLLPAAVQAQHYCEPAFYEGVPASADFPIPPAKFEEWLGFNPELPAPSYPASPDRPKPGNLSALRRHIWKIWSELTADSKSTRPDVEGFLPRFETWFSAHEVLAESVKISPSKPRVTVGHPFYERPPELLALNLLTVLNHRWKVPEPNQDVRYSQTVCRQIIDQHLGSNAVRDRLQQSTHTVPEFKDKTSIILKPMFIPIPDTGPCAVLPVWDDVPSEPKMRANLPILWANRIQVRASQQQQCEDPKNTYNLDRFYHRRIQEGESDQVASGYWILVGMHVITKEIEPWVWSTLWWHDSALSGASPFTADRDGVSIRPVWMNYVMDVAADMERPWQHDAQPRAIYNPYLEALFPDGTRSNCMACHARASWNGKDGLKRRETLASRGGTIGFPAIVVTGREAAADTYFEEAASVLNLRFLWSLSRPEPEPQALPTTTQTNPGAAASKIMPRRPSR